MNKIVLLLSSCMLSATVSGRSIPAETPVSFIENKGQWPEEILYKSTSTSTSVSLMKNGLSFAHLGEEIEGRQEYPYIVWNMLFENTSAGMFIDAADSRESVVSFFYGNDPDKWVVHPPESRSVYYKNIYDRIDLHLYGNGYELKYDYIISPGGDMNSIVSSFEGIEGLHINDAGELVITTAWSKQIQKKPVAWQVVNGTNRPVDVRYRITGKHTFGFVTDDTLDPAYELVIDPLFQMVWASYTKAIGASNNINYCFSNAVDANGDVYMTGMVDGTFPTTPGAYNGPGSIVPEIFVSKFSADGTTMLYSTYLSGSSSEMGLGIDVDAGGRAFITGHVSTNITGGNTYPTTANAYQPALNLHSGSEVILTVLNPTGTALEYSSFLGGSGGEDAYDLVLDNNGMAYITGYTTSSDFPIKASAPMQQGSHSLFVAKFDVSQSGQNSLVYSLKIGGGGNAGGRGIAVDNSGNAYVTGYYSDFGTPPFYPVTPGAYNTTYNGGNDGGMAIVTKLSGTLPVTMVYSTFIGPGIGNDIAVHSQSGEAFITGGTRTFAFPVTPGVLQPVHAQDALGNPNLDAFVARLNAPGSSLVYSTQAGRKYNWMRCCCRLLPPVSTSASS